MGRFPDGGRGIIFRFEYDSRFDEWHILVLANLEIKIIQSQSL